MVKSYIFEFTHCLILLFSIVYLFVDYAGDLPFIFPQINILYKNRHIVMGIFSRVMILGNILVSMIGTHR